MRHLTSLNDLSPEDIGEILDFSTQLKSQYKEGTRPQLLPGRVLAQVFEKPSLRTRNSFEAAMVHLGGEGIFLLGKEAGLNGRESLPDIARVLSSYSDVVTLRTYSQELVEEFAQNASCPVINALTDDFHPCQALTDLLTIQEVFGSTEGRRLVYVGDGNNICRSLAIIASMTDLSLTVAGPEEFHLSDEFLNSLKSDFPNAQIAQTTDAHAAVRDAEIVYTDVWASMGQEDEAEERKRIFSPYQVNAELMASAPEGCRFMHDLPAKRGSEVTDEVIDGPASVVFQQAENRMHLAKGLIAWLLGVKPTA